MGRSIIAIDFDGTIVEHQFPEIGDPVSGAFNWMRKWKEAGAILILWTMRSDGQQHGDVLTQAVKFCRDNGLEFDFVNEHPQEWTTSPKVYAHTYVDDAALGCPLLSALSGGRPVVDWHKVGPMVMDMIKTRAGS